MDDSLIGLIIFLLFLALFVFIIYQLREGRGNDYEVNHDRDTSRPRNRQDYYRNYYLKSDDWKRKRFVVLRRDNWRCVCCGEEATQVHHKRYARNIGREPIDWLISVCRTCHQDIHNGTISNEDYGN